MSAREPVAPLDLGAIERGLSLTAAAPVPEQPWLRDSQLAPARFFAGLRPWHEAAAPVPPRSVPFARYDFFHDLVLRHLKSDAPALVLCETGAPAAEVSYRDLALLASRRATAWQHAGVAVGQTVAIVRPLGLSCIASLLAGLKLGCLVALLPPSGRRFVANRLAELAPDHLDLDERYAPLLAGLELPAPLGADAPEHEADLERSVAYPTQAPVLRVFDPTSPTPAVPRTVPADAAYLGPLRDGLFTLGLRPGQAVAAPDAHLLETQPALLLSVLLAGGTYVHLTLDDVRRDPQLLAARPLKALGVSPAVREVVIARPINLAERCAVWFRDPAEGTELGRWQAFVAAAQLREAWAVNLKWDAASGGCALVSPRRKGVAHCQVLPAPGVEFFVADLVVDGQPALGASGRVALVPPGGAEPLTRPSVIAPQDGAWLYGGTVVPGVRGRTYPRDEVLASLEGLAGALGFSVCVTPGAAMAEPQVALLCFVGARTPVDEAALFAAIRRRIGAEMGAEFIPDRLVSLPLVPRRDDEGAVDHAWCRSQYLTASLGRKSNDELFRTLALLQEYATAAAKET